MIRSCYMRWSSKTVGFKAVYRNEGAPQHLRVSLYISGGKRAGHEALDTALPRDSNAIYA